MIRVARLLTLFAALTLIVGRRGSCDRQGPALPHEEQAGPRQGDSLRPDAARQRRAPLRAQGAWGPNLHLCGQARGRRRLRLDLQGSAGRVVQCTRRGRGKSLRRSHLAGPGRQQRHWRGRRARRRPVQKRSRGSCWRRSRMLAVAPSPQSPTSSGSTPRAASPPVRDAMRPTAVRKYASLTRRRMPSTIRPRPDPNTDGRDHNAPGRCGLRRAPGSDGNGVEGEWQRVPRTEPRRFRQREPQYEQLLYVVFARRPVDYRF